MSVDAEINQQDDLPRVLQLIDFLSEYNVQRNKPVRDISDYGLFRLTENSLPNHEAVQLSPSDTDWLTIDFIDPPQPPEVPAGIRDFVDDGKPLSPLSRPASTVPFPDPPDDLDLTLTDEEEEAAVLRAEAEFEIRSESVEAWIQNEWEPWFEAHGPAFRVKRIYRELVEQRERLMLDRESVELVWGFGRARWNNDSCTIDHPLVTVPVEITVDQETQCLTVTSAGQPEVEVGFLTGLDVHDRQSLDREQQTAMELEIDPWNAKEMSDLLRRLTRAIDVNGIVVRRAGTPGASLVVDQTWTLYLRRRMPDSQGFLEQMRSAYLAGGTVPTPLRDIVAQPAETGPDDRDHSGITAPNADPLLLPLPANEEQKRILELAQSHSGVTVSGPPGTGKSHTIANLISHYVAHGQRVLVVSEKEQALKVLADKVPEGIRDLMVPVLGADQDSRKSLEKSMETILSRVASFDRAAADGAIRRLQADLEATNRDLAETTAEMLHARQSEVEKAPGIWLAGKEPTPQAAAAWVRDNVDDLSFIPDVLGLATRFPLSAPEFAEYVDLLRSVGSGDAAQALRALPRLADLPDSAKIGRLFDSAAAEDAVARTVRFNFVNWESFIRSNPQRIQDVRAALLSYTVRLQDIESSAFSGRIRWLEHDLFKQKLTEYYRSLSELRQRAISYRQVLMATNIVISAPASAEFLRLVTEAHEKWKSAGKLGLFDRQHKRTMAAFTINGRPPQNADEAELCVIASMLELVRVQITRLFDIRSPRAGKVDFSHRPEDDVAEEVQGLGELLALPPMRQKMAARLTEIGLRTSWLATAAETRTLIDAIGVAMHHFAAEDTRVQLAALAAKLKRGADRTNASPLWLQLHEALVAQKRNKWGTLRDEVARLWALLEPARRLTALGDPLVAHAPKWVQRIEWNPAAAPDPDSAAAAWQWRQLDCWIRDNASLASPADLQSRIEELGRQRRHIVAGLVEMLAWRRLADSMGPRERRALQNYRQAVKGKTGGRQAQHWASVMREALDESKETVPVWLMTTARALASFRPAATPPFDVLIIDEASQIGFDALPLLSLAKKAIVVGDDKQASPESVWLDRQKVVDIMDDHLTDVPKYRTLFDPDNSLYDVAIQKFAASVTLSEHFRCLPEIIAFSNAQAYDGNIVPLRDHAPQPGWAPLGVLRVKDGYCEGEINEPEALQVVHLIAEMCQDEQYEGMTFGVVTLLDAGQAKLIRDLLYDRLGPELIQERKIRCIEAAGFQGDERDVIIVSTVVAVDPNHSTQILPMTSDTDLRKINLAASRARNQMWVVTSVDPEMLPNGDYRAALIRHCSGFQAEAPNQDHLLAACESEFERRVVTDLLNRGYRSLEVQKVVGRHRVDLVVSGRERRLAIECDGDRWHGPEAWSRDRARQQVLEQAGWTFEHIRGSAYFRDPHSKMQPVWEHLEELGIEPGDVWADGASRSLVREVTMADLPEQNVWVEGDSLSLVHEVVTLADLFEQEAPESDDSDQETLPVPASLIRDEAWEEPEAVPPAQPPAPVAALPVPSEPVEEHEDQQYGEAEDDFEYFLDFEFDADFDEEENASIPALEGEAAEAVAYRGGHVQIIAAAGSGKTEVVSQRVAALLAEGEDPASIVAFTFTEKAAAELKERIRQRVTARIGESAADQLGKLFVGTIHAYCFRLLQSYVPAYETYTPLDTNQLVNLLYRESNRLGLKWLDRNGKLFDGITAFQRSVDVVENELLDIDDLPSDGFKDALVSYYDMLDGYRFMSFGTQIVRAVQALEDPQVHAKMTAGLRHLIVDEYQDVNPAQERLIELLSKPHGNADLMVVGDDDQAIYQWRGSDVRNIVTFADRYDNVALFRLLVNRRSRPDIVHLANMFAQSIPERLPKEMGTHRVAEGPAVSIAADYYNEAAEAGAVARNIEQLHDRGVPYRDIAILVRGKVAYGKLLGALEGQGIPVQPGGRTGLFEQPEADAFGATYAWIADIDWSPRRFDGRVRVTLDILLAKLASTFNLGARDLGALRRHLVQWKERTGEKDFNVNLVDDFYALAKLLRLSEWDLADERQRNRLGTIARFTNVLADYETVTRRSRRDASAPDEQVGGAVGDEWFYRNLALLLVNYATGNYDDFNGEQALMTDGVALGTVHGAKGLEWPVVFLPSLTSKRFPSSNTGKAQDWLIDDNLFDAARYEGSDADERRLFYVALTRARDWVSLSAHQRVNTRTSPPSPYLTECSRFARPGGLPTVESTPGPENPDLGITYSDLAAYADCPQSYLLKRELGFLPPVKPEIGYGNAVHHVMRMLAEHTQAIGRLPSPHEVNNLLASGFFLPFANKAAHREMREKARQLVLKYVTDHSGDLLRTWATERPFELYLPGVVIRGRADVIYDEHDGTADNLAIVDYKTSTGGNLDPLQLQVYADAGRREGLIIGAAFIHDMGTAVRHAVPVDDAAARSAETKVLITAEALKQRDFTPLPKVKKCRACDVRNVCGAAKLK